MLMDVDMFVWIMLGVLEFEVIGQDIYKVIVNVKMGFVSGFFLGNLEVVEKYELESFVFKIQ